MNEKNQLFNKPNDGEQSLARVVWHIYSKERNLHFTIVLKTDPLTLLCFRLSFVVYFALLTIYLTTVQSTERERS